MKKSLYFLINILLYWALVTGFDVLKVGSFGAIAALLFGGILFALLSLAVEPVLKFFKFPTNFWGMFLVGFLLNLSYFVVASTGVISSLVTISAGRFGGEFAPIPFPVIELGSTLVVSVLFSILATLLQILVRRLGN